MKHPKHPLLTTALVAVLAALAVLPSAAAPAGQARGLRTVEVDGVTLDEGGPTVGVALDAAEDGMVWIMVALH